MSLSTTAALSLVSGLAAVCNDIVSPALGAVVATVTNAGLDPGRAVVPTRVPITSGALPVPSTAGVPDLALTAPFLAVVADRLPPRHGQKGVS